jgi:hypothetical protein
MTKQEEIARAHRAKAAKPYLDELISEVKSRILTTFVDADPFDKDAMDDIRLLKVQYDGIVLLEQRIQSHINSGKMSEMDLNNGN